MTRIDPQASRTRSCLDVVAAALTGGETELRAAVAALTDRELRRLDNTLYLVRALAYTEANRRRRT